MGLFAKTLPRGIREYQLGKSLKDLRDLYDPKVWGEYKVELHKWDRVVSYVLRMPMDPKSAFKVISVDCPVSDDAEFLYDTSAFRLSFFYRSEVKRELGEQAMVDQAVKRYGGVPRTVPTDPSGFYKTVRWEDKKTRIELGLGHQYDRLQFLDRPLADWLTAAEPQENHKVKKFTELF